MIKNLKPLQSGLILVFGGVMLSWHLFSLNISPLPWFDEVFYASMTLSFLEGNGLVPDVVPFESNRQVFTYGPVYFLLTAASTSLLGFGIFSFRLVNFLFGIATIFVVFRMLQKQNLPEWIFVLAFAAFCLDPRYLQNIHNGRMDQVALFFSMGALYLSLYKKGLPNQPALMALLLSLALLTSPRLFFIVLPIGFVATFEMLKERNWVQLIVFLSVPVILASVWIAFSFGSVQEAWDYYFSSDNARKAARVSRFLGGNLQIAFFQYPLLLSTLALILISFRLLIRDRLAVLSAVFLVLFYVLIHDTGLYSSIIVVFFYLLMALAAKYTPLKTLAYILMSLVLVVNISIFAFKSMTILAQLNERSPENIEVFVRSNVPPGSRVAGDERYYYAFVKHNCEFQFINRKAELGERVLYHKNQYGARFIMLGDETDPDIIKAYRETFLIYKEVPFSLERKETRFRALLDQMNPMNNYGTYEGVLLLVGDPRDDIH